MKLVRKKPKTETRMIVGLPEFTRPAFLDTLRLPANITQLGDAELSDMLGKYTAAYAFASTQRAAEDIAMLDIENKIARRRATIMGQNLQMITTMERYRRDAILEIDDQLMDLQHLLKLHKQRREWAFTMVGSFDRILNTLSRELTRKLSMRSGDYSEPSAGVVGRRVRVRNGLRSAV